MKSSFFQTPEWEQFKLKTGYEKSYRIDNILVLQRSLPFGRSMLYSPMVSKAQIDSIQKEFIAKIKEVAKENSALFYRLELDIPKNTPSTLPLTKGEKVGIGQNFVKSFEEMQPENNWVVNVSKNKEEILAAMKQKGRYNIRVAEKNNVAITSSNAKGEELDIFYDLYSKTAKRKKVTFRGKAYFENLLDILGKIDYAKAYAAKTNIDGKEVPLAAAIIIFYGKEALYLYGGSSDDHKNLMAPYLLHWKIMLDAKKRGIERYNFLGIAPTEDQNHPWAGVTRFKKQFGGEQLDIAGSYDMIFKSIEYRAFKMAEQIRRK